MPLAKKNKATGLRRRSAQRIRKAALFEQLGPGLITGAADDDPSGIATYSQAGAQFGFNMLWTMVVTYPLMVAVQLVSAQIGRVTGSGLAKNLGAVFPKSLVVALVALLFVANTINIGADLAAMGAATRLAISGPTHLYTVGFALLSLTLQLFIPYARYASYLKWLTLVLLAYVAVVFTVEINWRDVAKGVVWPTFPLTNDSFTVIVAVLGTTISPYMFFWQSSQEVEELEKDPRAKALAKAPAQAPRELARIRLDTLAGMAVSNIVAMAIMVSTAATLHLHGKTHIATAADAAEALRPVAGDFAFALFCLGIVGTGLLAVPVLAGSAAYALCESQGWKFGLENKPWEAVGFYSVISVATLLGIGIELAQFDPIRALFWSAVINGFVAVPIIAAMMFVASRRDQMKRFTVSGGTLVLGWIATAVMAAAALSMIVV
jgi:NRAMP (natural resistance-associated macrophage protein)-like metal ion transporter